MKKGKDCLSYICLYYSYLCMIERLSDEELGKVICALFDYVENGKMAEFEGGMRGTFLNIVHGIDLDERKYRKRCKKKGEKENGA